MQDVANTLSDIRDQLRFDLGSLKLVTAAFVTITMGPPKVHVWTLVERRDEDSETQLVRAERRLMTSFPNVGFDFSTIHLRGRDPIQFIPEGAVPVKITDQRAREYFIRAATAHVQS